MAIVFRLKTNATLIVWTIDYLFDLCIDHKHKWLDKYYSVGDEGGGSGRKCSHSTALIVFCYFCWRWEKTRGIVFLTGDIFIVNMHIVYSFVPFQVDNNDNLITLFWSTALYNNQS